MENVYLPPTEALSNFGENSVAGQSILTGSEATATSGTPRGETEQPYDRGDRDVGFGNYELTFSPDWEVDQELLTDYCRVADEIGLSQEQAQRLADLYAGKLQGGAEKLQADLTGNMARQSEKWEAEVKSSPQFREDLHCAKRTLARFGGEELYQVLNQSGLGSHPAMFKFTAAIGRALGEPGFKGGSAPTRTEPAQVMYPNQK